MQKRILILDTGKEWGGGTNSLLELLRRIDREAFQFTGIFYHDYRKGKESTIETELEKMGIPFIFLKQEEQPAMAKFLKELLRVVFFFNQNLKRYFVFLVDYHVRIKPNTEKIVEVLKNHNADMLYLNNQPSSNLEGILAARQVNIPVIQHARSNASLLPMEVKLVNRNVASMICVSKGLKENYTKQGVRENMVTVVHNGIDIRRGPEAPPEAILRDMGVKDGEVVIGMVGSLIKRKGFDVFIRALSHLKNAGAHFKGVIIGDGPEREQLTRLVDTLGLTERTVFTGFKADGLSYINALDILVLSSPREGLPRVILEAMLLEKPVVVSDIPGPSELVVHNETGYLAPSGQPSAFADCLRWLIEDPEKRKQMGKKGKERVIEHFSIEKYVHGVEGVFREVLGLRK
jgi:glycosyltransferase involved in cell wall biosynthesis